MNKCKFYFSLCLVFFSLFFIASCDKDDINESIDTTIMSETRSLDISKIRNMPTVVSEILKFNSKQHLSEFFEDINDFELEEIEELETYLNFNSLRKEYENLEDGNPNWRDNQLFVIENPFDVLTFNEYHEIWVDDEIYKLVDKNLIARTSSPFVNEIVSMRSNGLDREHVELVDRIQKRLVPGTITTRSTCTMDITMPFDPTKVNANPDTKLFGYIQPVIIDEEGNKTSICAGNITIDWGDGQISTHSNAEISKIRVHKYNVGLGECKTFTVKITFDATLCGSCTESGGMSFVTESDLVFCHPVSCTPFEHETGEGLVFDDVYGGTSGNEYGVQFFMGYDSDDYLWHDARAWGKIKHFRKYQAAPGVFIYVPSPFKVNCKITIHGAVFEETCSGIRIPVTNETSGTKNKKELKYMWKLDDVNFRLRSDDDLFCDFEVFNQHVTNGNISLIAREYSNL